MSKKVVPDMAFDESSSDDDEAPEEISVSASRQQGIDQLKDVQALLKKSKDEEKEKRRQRNEMFHIQKENKLKDLSKRKLPEDVLAAVSAKVLKKSQAEVAAKPATPNKPVGENNDDEDDDEENIAEISDEGNNDLIDSGVEDVSDGYSPMEEYIPLSKSGNLVLATPAAMARKTEVAAQKAGNFKYERLYNQSTIPRETNKQRLARKAKRLAKHSM